MKQYWLFLLTFILIPAANDPLPDSTEELMVEFIREPENVKVPDLKPGFNCTDEIMKNPCFSSAKDPLKDIVGWSPSQKDNGWNLATTKGERDGYEMVEFNTVVNGFKRMI